jgi:hypothetical protein
MVPFRTLGSEGADSTVLLDAALRRARGPGTRQQSTNGRTATRTPRSNPGRLLAVSPWVTSSGANTERVTARRNTPPRTRRQVGGGSPGGRPPAGTRAACPCPREFRTISPAGSAGIPWNRNREVRLRTGGDGAIRRCPASLLRSGGLSVLDPLAALGPHPTEAATREERPLGGRRAPPAAVAAWSPFATTAALAWSSAWSTPLCPREAPGAPPRQARLPKTEGPARTCGLAGPRPRDPGGTR